MATNLYRTKSDTQAVIDIIAWLHGIDEGCYLPRMIHLERCASERKLAPSHEGQIASGWTQQAQVLNDKAVRRKCVGFLKQRTQLRKVAKEEAEAQATIEQKLIDAAEWVDALTSLSDAVDTEATHCAINEAESEKDASSARPHCICSMREMSVGYRLPPFQGQEFQA